MELKQFNAQLESSKDLSGVGMQFNEDGSLKGLVIKHEPTKIEVKLPVDAIIKSEWEVLYDVMTGKREPAVLQHMTRVVGYYSKIENWNPSKIGELKDRQAGDYEFK
jgi:hypothetical protein